nr:hypothetical protein OG999_26390 [Streptomyces sp. NBC_00886]
MMCTTAGALTAECEHNTLSYRLGRWQELTGGDFLSEAVAQALARDRSDRRARLDRSLDALLCAYTPEEVTAAVTRRIRPSI